MYDSSNYASHAEYVLHLRGKNFSYYFFYQHLIPTGFLSVLLCAVRCKMLVEKNLYL